MNPSYSTSASSHLSGASAVALILVWAVLMVISIAGMWKLFKKAGQPGWASIVPFYNIYVLTQIAGRPEWWFLLFFVPFANIVVGIIVSLDIAKAFGKSMAFAIIGMILFAPIGYLILGFGSAAYRGNALNDTAPTPPTQPTPPPATPTTPTAPTPPAV